MTSVSLFWLGVNYHCFMDKGLASICNAKTKWRNRIGLYATFSLSKSILIRIICISLSYLHFTGFSGSSSSLYWEVFLWMATGFKALSLLVLFLPLFQWATRDSGFAAIPALLSSTYWKTESLSELQTYYLAPILPKISSINSFYCIQFSAVIPISKSTESTFLALVSMEVIPLLTTRTLSCVLLTEDAIQAKEMEGVLLCTL